MTRRPTPFELGYRMPAEWAPHEATWLSWPHKLASWPDAFEPVPGVFVQIARRLAESELVRINVADKAMAEHVRTLLAKGGVNLKAVRFHLNPTNDAWMRDHGPMWVVHEEGGRRKRAITDWKYNAWGGKYPPFDLDDAVPGRIATEFGEERFETGIVMEGGSLDVNGRGSLLTTEACLLNKNRNPSLDREQIEKYLHDYLGATNVLWLGEGIDGDDTDGHIDDLTRFVGPSRVVTAVERDPAAVDFEVLNENLKRLKTMKDEQGRPLEIVTLPMPEPVLHDGEPLPASYANFYIANNRVLVPTYRQPNDRIAIATLQKLFPNRLAVGIDCTDLCWGLGAIHCVTQQQPRVLA